MADLSQIVASGRQIEIYYPNTTTPIGVRIDMVSLQDPRLLKLQRRMLDNRLQMEKRGKVFGADEITTNLNELLFTSCVSWDWYTPEGGTPATFKDAVPDLNRKNLFEIFDTLPWFREQMNEALGDTEAFFKASKPD
jgi:hypothetical protein